MIETAAFSRETGFRLNRYRHPACLLLAALCSMGSGLAADKPSAEIKHRVKKVGPKLYRVGDVTVDAKLGVAAFPAKVNQLVGLIEYALVTEAGKVHESFLSTKVRPSDIHAALLLLSVKPLSGVNVDVGWKVGGKWVRKPIADCVGQYPLEAASERDDKVTDKSFHLKSRGWKWTGARLRNGNLTADETGSILSLQPDIDALTLLEPMVDTGRYGIHVWPKRVPKIGQTVQVFLSKRKVSKP